MSDLPFQEDAVKRFLQRHAERITGVLSGFDRLVLRGTLRRLAFPEGLKGFLAHRNVLLKGFGPFALALTERLKEASLAPARQLGRPVHYLSSSRTSKEDMARNILAQDPLAEGLVCVLKCVEPCRSYEIYRNRDTKRLELLPRLRKGLFLYHYFVDPVFGFLNARIQTWLPFNVQICLNGREWLARQMDAAGLAYRRRDNAFVWIEDFERAQALADQQLRLAWPAALDRIARLLNPAHEEIFEGFPLQHYWSVYQSEWATDIVFRDAASLAAIYPGLVRHAITALSSPDVMRFLGRKVHAAFQGEIVSDFKDRPEGIRVKHRVDLNSVKIYDKHGLLLRVETTLNEPRDFKVFRPREGERNGPRAWRPLRQGIADLNRRAQVSQASNERYLDALTDADTSTPLGELVRPICRPATLQGKRVRALRPWSEDDLALFRAVNRGEFALNGFRNRDLQALLFPTPASPSQDKRRRSARVTRLLRILRAHRLIRKVPSTHRYVATSRGRQILSAILNAQAVTLDQLAKLAA